MSEPTQDSTVVYDPDMDPTDGYEAYLFIEQTSSTTLDAITGTDGVRRLDRLYSGRFAAVAFLQVAGDFLALTSLIMNLMEMLTGDDCCSKGDVAVPLKFAVSPNPGPLRPSRWLKKPPVRALVQVRAREGHANAVLQAAQQLQPAFLGGAIVAGSYDLLLEFGWDTFDAAAKALLSQVNTLPGVRWTETSLTLGGP